MRLTRWIRLLWSCFLEHILFLKFLKYCPKFRYRFSQGIYRHKLAIVYCFNQSYPYFWLKIRNKTRCPFSAIEKSPTHFIFCCCCCFSSFRSDGTTSFIKRKQILIIWIKYCIKIIPHENTTLISFYWRFSFDHPFFLVLKRDGGIWICQRLKEISSLFKDKTTNASWSYIVKKNTFMFVWVSSMSKWVPEINILES